jgi:hypothetical protein
MNPIDVPTDADEAAQHLAELIDHAERGDRTALIGLREVLALTPLIWRKHCVLAMRAERVWLEAMIEMRKRAQRQNDAPTGDSSKNGPVISFVSGRQVRSLQVRLRAVVEGVLQTRWRSG